MAKPIRKRKQPAPRGTSSELLHILTLVEALSNTDLRQLPELANGVVREQMVNRSKELTSFIHRKVKCHFEGRKELLDAELIAVDSETGRVLVAFDEDKATVGSEDDVYKVPSTWIETVF